MLQRGSRKTSEYLARGKERGVLYCVFPKVYAATEAARRSRFDKAHLAEHLNFIRRLLVQSQLSKLKCKDCLGRALKASKTWGKKPTKSDVAREAKSVCTAGFVGS